LATNSAWLDADERVAKLVPKVIGTQPLELRRLGSDDAVALCELFRARDHVVLDGNPATTWRFEPTQVASPSGVILHGAREDVALCINDDGMCDALGERLWSDYGPESQFLAWLLAHHTLLESLGRLLSEPLMPRARGEGSRPVSVSLSIMLAFSVTADDGRVTRGTLGLSPAMTSRLAAHPGWRPRPGFLDPWKALPATVRIALSEPSFPLSELQATQIGDVLVLGRRVHCWSHLRLVRLGARSNALPGAWSASYDGSQIKVERPVSENPSVETSETVPPDALARTPVTLEFELGQLTLPLGEIAGLAPGYVFQLPGRLEDARVVIRAGGRVIGRGELVAVGEVLGVQVTALEADAFQ
jgi:type III secretion protein Q